MPLRSQPSRLRRLWRDYSLTIVVGVLFLFSFVLHAIFGWWQYVADQANQGQPATLFGWDGYVIYFGEWTFQNWQSEFLEVLALIVLTAFLVHKGSHESKDSDDAMQASIDRIERKVDELAERSGRHLDRRAG
jgi:succinate dehydrogenase hydrophobic anchor subunit